MAEKCVKCKQTAQTVNIGGRSYCSSCGEPISRAAGRSLQDLGPRRESAAAPARVLHTRTGLAKGGVIDLRSNTSTPAIIPNRRKSKPSKASAPAAAPEPTFAKHERSAHISRFHTPKAASSVPDQVTPKSHSKADTPKKSIPAHTETHHRAMAKLATRTHAHQPKTIPSLHRYAAVAVAVVVMSGYVWLQNYPKLKLHSASSKAGFALTLPAYLPSSYSLSGPVEASNGHATISFKSPSAKDHLKITQRTTSWDSSSLRANVIDTKASDYTSVNGQGLTIYLWGGNAAWVNHGIWYGIEGASNLSREQLLKIAYSL
jgi:hypothetical protein